MKKFAVLTAVLLIILTGCSHKKIPEIKEDVILVNLYTNYAWGLVCSGSFIDKEIVQSEGYRFLEVPIKDFIFYFYYKINWNLDNKSY